MAMRVVIGVVDSSGLTYIGHTDFKRNVEGYIQLREAQCILRWWTSAHINHLVNGICNGVELGAKADVFIKDFVFYIEPKFATIDEWKATDIGKGAVEKLGMADPKKEETK